jgi:hypothetical protein
MTLNPEVALRRTIIFGTIGVTVTVCWLMWLMITEFRVMRHDFIDLRVEVTTLHDQVISIDQFGGRALREHKLEAHDRAH